MTAPSVDEQVQRLMRGTVFADEVGDLEPQGLRQKMEKELTAMLGLDRPLRIYQGVDPTASSLHLGHMVAVHKLRQFQALGHQVIFLIGDYTAMIGDPSGQSAERKRLSHEDVTAHAKHYTDQAFHLLDEEKTAVRRNGQWLSKLTFAQLIELAALFPLKQIIARKDFKERMDQGDSLRFHECLYALMQGYDAHALRCDVQVGGYDQHFNMLAGRAIQQAKGERPHVMLTMPLLMGTDGRKMSKTYGNSVFLDDTPQDMYGKCMRITDELIPQFLDLATTFEPKRIDELKEGLSSGKAHPKDVKKALARRITAQYHGEEGAEAGEQAFARMSEKRAAPSDVPHKDIDVGTEGLWLPKALAQLGLVDSSSQGRRMVKQGAVSLGGEKITNLEHKLKAGPEVLIKVGKRRYMRVTAR